MTEVGMLSGSCTRCPYPHTNCHHPGDLECLQKKENEPDPDGEEALNYFLFPWTEEEEERNEGAR
jgi:hypothetical protein